MPSTVATASSSNSSRSCATWGFTVKLKPYIQRSDGSAKGDWDVGITIDIMDAAANVDEVVLASGDGDFDMLARPHHPQAWRRSRGLRRCRG